MIIINLIKDILDIIKDDTRHSFKICIDTLGVTIYLDDDPDDTFEEEFVIPVTYDTLLESSFIPHEEYIKCMSGKTDAGIDKEQIDLIQKIMEYLENNKESIDSYCSSLSRYQREKSIHNPI